MSNGDIIPKPILVLPVCSHTFPQVTDAIQNIIEIFERLNETATLTNVSTDGDPYRRKVLEELRQPSNKTLFSQMKYFDKNLFLGRYGINYDIKHLIKRIKGHYNFI